MDVKEDVRHGRRFNLKASAVLGTGSTTLQVQARAPRSKQGRGHGDISHCRNNRKLGRATLPCTRAGKRFRSQDSFA